MGSSAPTQDSFLGQRLRGLPGKERASVRRDLPGKFIQRYAPNFGDALGRVDDPRRLVGPLSAEGLGTEVGRVSLDQNAVGGNQSGDGAEVVLFLESDHAGKADVQSEGEKLGRLLGRARKRVHDAPQSSA